MDYHLFIDSNSKYRVTGNDTPSNFYYNVEGFLPDEYEYYYVKLEYVIINHNIDTVDAFTYLPYDSYTYNIMIDFRTGSNIYSDDSYLNIFSGPTHQYKKDPYWKTTTNTVGNTYSLNIPNIEGRNGPSLIINRPQNVINIKILNNDGGELLDVDTPPATIPRIKMLLKFSPYIDN